MDARIAAIPRPQAPEDFLTVLTEPAGPPPVTQVLHRGDYRRQPRDAVTPAGLERRLGAGGRPIEFADKDPDLPTSGRRLAFARWLTSATNPIVSRARQPRVDASLRARTCGNAFWTSAQW